MASVLVVDDDVVFAASVAEALEKQGHHCQRSSTLELARELVRFNQFQVCILDHILTDEETGLDLLPLLQEKRIASIFVTAFPQPETFQKAWALGVTETFHKPVNLELLADAILIACEVGPSAPYTGHIDLDQFKKKETDPKLYPRLFIETLTDLQQSLGSELPLELIEQLRDQCKADCGTILRAETNADFSTAKQAAHRLAGALMNFGLQRAEIMARAIHDYADKAQPETWSQTKNLIEEIPPSLDEACQFLKAC